MDDMMGTIGEYFEDFRIADFLGGLALGAGILVLLEWLLDFIPAPPA